MEPSRRWQPKLDLPYGHTVLRSWTFDLARLAVGAGLKTRRCGTFSFQSARSPPSRGRARRCRRGGQEILAITLDTCVNRPLRKTVKLGFRSSGFGATCLGYGSSTFWAVSLL